MKRKYIQKNIPISHGKQGKNALANINYVAAECELLKIRENN